MKQTLNTNRSKIRLTKSPKSFAFFVSIFSVLFCFLGCSYVWLANDTLAVRISTSIVAVGVLLFLAYKLKQLSEAYFMTDMILVDPLYGKGIITPIQGIKLKKSFKLGPFFFCAVTVRLDGKKMSYLLFGGCDQLTSEQIKIEDFLLGINKKKNKKVNHKPGSVSSVA